ncbi:hypothetical protein Q7P37_008192 [Cladosporium fusiforme]
MCEFVSEESRASFAEVRHGRCHRELAEDRETKPSDTFPSTKAMSRNILMRSSRALAFGSSRALSSTTRHAAFAPSRTSFQNTIAKPATFSTTRYYSSEAPSSAVEPPDFLDEGELKVFNMLKEGLKPVRLEVQDVSGGCGSMYALDIVSEQFKGLPIVKQHRLVNSVLGEEIKKWHGVQMKTKAP